MDAPNDVLAVAVHLRVAPDDLDLVSGVLWDLGVLGIEEVESDEGGVALVATVEDRSAATALVGALRGGSTPATADRVAVVAAVDVTDDGWRDAWRTFATAVRAGRHLVVVPPWLDPPPDLADDDLVLRVDPGRAFGSGSHPSTRLALAALERAVSAGDRVLDVGCGSGVLAVAAARLGADEVAAVDVDPEAVRATVHNAATAGVAEVVRAALATVDDVPGTFDVVVANIGVRVLVEVAPALVARVQPGGTLVLSGILVERRAEIDRAFAELGWAPVAVLAESDWVALTLAPSAVP